MSIDPLTGRKTTRLDNAPENLTSVGIYEVRAVLGPLKEGATNVMIDSYNAKIRIEQQDPIMLAHAFVVPIYASVVGLFISHDFLRGTIPSAFTILLFRPFTGVLSNIIV